MTIQDARFASAWRTDSKQERHFDDIGCMVTAFRRQRPSEGTQFFVHDFRDESWLDATHASFLVTTEVKTPMGYGVVAVSGAGAAAELFQADTPVPWVQLLQQLEGRS
jgi:copper chaperone NosL